MFNPKPSPTGLPAAAPVHEAVAAGSFLPGHPHKGVAPPAPMALLAPPVPPVPKVPVATPCRAGKRRKLRPQTPPIMRRANTGSSLTTTEQLSPSSQHQKAQAMQPPPSPAPSVASASSSSGLSTYEDGTYWRNPVYIAIVHI